MKNNKGITMISLVIIIIVLLILAGISITTGTINIKETNQNKYQIDIGIIYNAICQRYTTVSLTGEELPGQKLTSTSSEIKEFEKATGLTVASGDEGEYYKLNKEDMVKLGIDNAIDEYIVNYKKGQVLNLSRYLENGEKIYIST